MSPITINAIASVYLITLPDVLNVTGPLWLVILHKVVPRILGALLGFEALAQLNHWPI